MPLRETNALTDYQDLRQVCFHMSGNLNIYPRCLAALELGNSKDNRKKNLMVHESTNTNTDC